MNTRMSIGGKFAVAAVVFAMSYVAGAGVRVACVGDSITYGYGLANRESESYPAQLQKKVSEETGAIFVDTFGAVQRAGIR